ncbi:hypothetical protein [Streptosporangium roseum]|uniref:hypothetical protein n=1 Tax=Streptosporangium roseum TaxID=2001 RepID=UPI0033164FE0
MTDDETPDPATAAATTPMLPPGSQIGLREARTRLGELTDRARYEGGPATEPDRTLSRFGEIRRGGRCGPAEGRITQENAGYRR